MSKNTSSFFKHFHGLLNCVSQGVWMPGDGSSGSPTNFPAWEGGRQKFTDTIKIRVSRQTCPKWHTDTTSEGERVTRERVSHRAHKTQAPHTLTRTDGGEHRSAHDSRASRDHHTDHRTKGDNNVQSPPSHTNCLKHPTKPDFWPHKSPTSLTIPLLL